MTAISFTRLAPGGSAIPLSSCLSLLRPGDPAAALCAGLAGLLDGAGVTLHASGREALRVALRHLAARSGRQEVVVPAYACFSVPAAAVAAGLRVRVVDVTPEGALDPEQLARTPLQGVAAVVVCNLFGLPEPTAPLGRIASAAGVALVDDAAQALGAGGDDGRAGARGEVGVLSFGRGKPLPALGGGALVWPGGAPDLAGSGCASPRPLRAVARAVVYDLARLPWLFRGLAAIPGLGIGETVYDPGFARGPMDGASLCLAAGLLPHLVDEARARAERALALARRIAAETSFRPLVAAEKARGVYPRLAVLAPGPAAREAALAALVRFGATRFYPGTLAEIPALRPHLAGEASCPGARDLAARLLTLPTHGGLTERRASAVAARLAALR
jgi:dTDP-4-amino-4,6-dideoxygalactose transaminase